MKKNALFLFLFCIILSCDNSSERLAEVVKENLQLKEEIKKLNSSINNYKFMPVLYPKESRIKLGEYYEAAFFTGIYSNEKPPIIIVYNREEPRFVDTLSYEENERGSIFKFKPANKGHYVFFADMKIPTIMDTLLFPIKWEFDVE
jgi:hypothetical protein